MSYEDRTFPFAHRDIILIVPPFAAMWQPNLACHLLQRCAQERGFDVGVIYGNLIYASMVGEQLYRQMEEGLVLEHIFKNDAFSYSSSMEGIFGDNLILEEGAKVAGLWLERMADIIRSIAPRIVGCTCSFEQISSSIAVLNRCKEINPDIITIIGGANCEGDMADGILSLGGRIDFVASGESEESFPLFLEDVLVNKRRPSRIIHGKPCTNLDQLPLPVYYEYFEQYKFYLPGDEQSTSGRVAVPYETSRGCWWGQKHHCTFCGLNGLTMDFREKSAGRALTEFKTLCESYPINQINVVDNIMPHKYFKELLPRLAAEIPEQITIFYEQKANITLARAMQLKEARITVIQPGIESLNSNILRCMDKGIKGYQNIALLRYARSLGIDVTWNLLIGFPGDRREDYEEMAALIPYISHLQPPDGLCFLRLDRFSPYFTNPERYGISNLRPKAIYAEIFPKTTDLYKLAYHFDGDYHCGAFECPEVLEDIAKKTETWRQRWRVKPKPILAVAHLFKDQFVLIDTRGLPESLEVQLLDRQQVTIVLTGACLDQRDQVAWALERKLLFESDERLIALATAPPALLMEFENSTFPRI